MKKSLHLQSGQQRGWEDVPFLDARKLPLALVFDFTPGSSTTVFCMKHHLWWGFAAIYSTQMSIYTARHFIHPKKLMPKILLVTMAVLPWCPGQKLFSAQTYGARQGPGCTFFFKREAVKPSAWWHWKIVFFQKGVDCFFVKGSGRWSSIVHVPVLCLDVRCFFWPLYGNSEVEIWRLLRELFGVSHVEIAAIWKDRPVYTSQQEASNHGSSQSAEVSHFFSTRCFEDSDVDILGFPFQFFVDISGVISNDWFIGVFIYLIFNSKDVSAGLWEASTIVRHQHH